VNVAPTRPLLFFPLRSSFQQPFPHVSEVHAFAAPFRFSSPVVVLSAGLFPGVVCAPGRLGPRALPLSAPFLCYVHGTGPPRGVRARRNEFCRPLSYHADTAAFFFSPPQFVCSSVTSTLTFSSDLPRPSPPAASSATPGFFLSAGFLSHCLFGVRRFFDDLRRRWSDVGVGIIFSPWEPCHLWPRPCFCAHSEFSFLVSPPSSFRDPPREVGVAGAFGLGVSPDRIFGRLAEHECIPAPRPGAITRAGVGLPSGFLPANVGRFFFCSAATQRCRDTTAGALAGGGAFFFPPSFASFSP